MPSPFRLLTRPTSTIGLALTMYDLWRRIPPTQRRQLLAATRKHGPRLAKKAVRRRRPPKGPTPPAVA